MKNVRQALALAAMATGMTLTGCHTPQTVTETAASTAPQAQKSTDVTVTAVAPQDEDAWLFRKRLAKAEVPDAVKAALQAGKPADAKLIRKFPYPYRSMVAISSDIDDTTPEEFAEYHRFLNTKEETPHGRGLGLDVGDSFWMYMANDQGGKTDQSGHGLDGVLTYFQGTDPTKKNFAQAIKHYWKAGWLDSMHTFGDFSRKNHGDAVFKRDYAVKAWEALQADDIRLDVWINHGNEANVDAFGAYDPHRFSAYQSGDDPKSPNYHTDLTVKNGVHFVWDSVGESTVGWDSPLFEIKLRDGQKVWGFHRDTQDRAANGSIDWNWVPREIHRQINQGNLDSLVDHQQYAIFAQHLGGYNIGFPFDERGLASLRLLAQYQDDGKVLVARTSRLLHYEVARKYVQVAQTDFDGETWLNVTGIADPLFGPQPLTIDAVRGLTFYVKNPSKTHLLLNLKPIKPEDYQFNAADATGQESIEFKWFKPDYTDYTLTSTDQ
ncbi:hypothetical protein [Tumebacillus flagellatus]|uniref:Lipoprotein n=1 Tax=Tumebacillus flagellatus TaxID=1157490 RepID=A0A074LPZ1_9BACL|nr:hypothetical protein [Tumebacillus flagellatus]KEO83144.1 hypothetical protein EL26_11790 [Tumebacillus flagellatus]